MRESICMYINKIKKLDRNTFKQWRGVNIFRKDNKV